MLACRSVRPVLTSPPSGSCHGRPAGSTSAARPPSPASAATCADSRGSSHGSPRYGGGALSPPRRANPASAGGPGGPAVSRPGRPGGGGVGPPGAPPPPAPPPPPPRPPAPPRAPRRRPPAEVVAARAQQRRRLREVDEVRRRLHAHPRPHDDASDGDRRQELVEVGVRRIPHGGVILRAEVLDDHLLHMTVPTVRRAD